MDPHFSDNPPPALAIASILAILAWIAWSDFKAYRQRVQYRQSPPAGKP